MPLPPLRSVCAAFATMVSAALAALAALLLPIPLATAHEGPHEGLHAVAEAPVARASEAMRLAAAEWLETLDDDQRRAAKFDFDGPVRTDWHFVPKERVGIALKEMDLEQRRAARALMRSALSDRGYLKATTVMSLERVLRLIEADRPDVESIRDPEKYWLAVFGDPGAGDGSPWGWRVEGHHVSLNFTSAVSDVAPTPLFLGANPAEVRVGPRLGLRALGEEDDRGRALMASLDAGQRARATIAAEAPADVAGVPGAPPEIAGGPVGLPAADMNDAQRALLRRLIESFAHCLRPELAEAQLDGIATAGFDRLHFAWAGGLETLADVATPVRHYFRVHGPTCVLELDFQEPNHVHAVWHSPDDDFGLKTLGRHYERHAH